MPRTCLCSANRRAVLKAGAAGMLLAALPARGGEDKLSEILQPPNPGREAFMQRAFELRRLAIERGDQGYGAIIVRGGRIVGEGVSAVVTTPDPTAHAEMQAIRDAARRLGTPDLGGGEMYGTSRACPMCEAGAYWAGISRLWHGSPAGGGESPRLR